FLQMKLQFLFQLVFHPGFEEERPQSQFQPIEHGKSFQYLHPSRSSSRQTTAASVAPALSNVNIEGESPVRRLAAAVRKTLRLKLKPAVHSLNSFKGTGFSPSPRRFGSRITIHRRGLKRDHSYRIAIKGSTFVARRAGT